MPYAVRKSSRLKNYDYSSSGAYFITFCVKDKACLLSSVVGRGVLDAPYIKLSDYGRLLDLIIKTAQRNDQINVDNYVIMPNHVHMLVTVNREPDGASGTPRPTNSVISRYIGYLKRISSKSYGINIWQTGFYDHIIRDEYDYQIHSKYIAENPAKWVEDKYYIKNEL